MDWNDIKLIIEIARSGSFSGAAANIGSSKPTVSRQIAKLELDSGARLFHRTPQGATLTAAGQELVERALRIEDAVLDFERRLRALGNNPERLVSVRMSEGVAAYLISPVVAGQDMGPLGIAARRLGIGIPPIKIMAPTDPGRSDISLAWAPVGVVPPASPGDKVKKLATISFVPFFSRQYQKLMPEAFEDLEKCPLVTLSAYKWFSNDGWADWHRAVAASPRVVSSDWSCSVGHFTFQGVGIGLLPTYSTMYTDNLHRLELNSPTMAAALWMVWPEDGGRDPLVRRCLDALSKLFAEAEWVAP